MSNDDRDSFERRAGALLRDSAEQLDGATRSRLARARAQALEQRASHGVFSFRYLAPAGATAAAVLAAVLYLGRGPLTGPVNGEGVAALDDMELLADADAFDLGQETDLDFIEWAAAMGPAEAAGG